MGILKMFNNKGESLLTGRGDEMMKNERRFKKMLLPVVLFGLLVSVGCDYAATSSPEASSLDLAKAGATVRAEDITFATWSPEVMAEMHTALMKGDPPGEQSKKVKVKKGGKVGGKKTFGNFVKIPGGAIDANKKKLKITVSTACMENNNPCAAEIEFLPSQKFLKDVEITLNYKALGYDGDPYELEIIWLEEDGDAGVVTDFTIDEEKGRVSFYINHFTRYGWAF